MTTVKPNLCDDATSSDATSSDALAAAVEVMMPALDEMASLVVVCDADRRVVGCNRAFEVETQWARDDIVGEEVDGLLDTLDVEFRTCSLGLAAGSAFVGHPAQATLSEIEERLAQAQRLMDLGQLATGVAHELKNPLTSILNYADYLLDKYRGQFFEKRDSERLQRIVDGVERMDRFVRDLLQLARTDEMVVRDRVSIHEAVESAVRLCAITLDSAAVTVTSRLDAPQARVRGVRSQLEQVFVNLITNGADAMPAGGGIIEVTVEVHGDEVVCRISDDGEGMSDATRQRIFEPFFTTRTDTDGTGLGLALVRTILDRHQGDIGVESTPGEGTTFTVTLPLAD